MNERNTSISIAVITPYDYHQFDQVIAYLHDKFFAEKIDSLIDRLSYISRYFLGRPYVLGALGEGENGKYDQSPLYQTSSFDCLTFVSMTVAIALSENLVDFKRLVARINYIDGKVAYECRNHFMSVDWNKNNAKIGVIVDITQSVCHQIGMSDCEYAETIIDRESWFRKRELSDLKLLNILNEESVGQLLSDLRNLGNATPNQSVLTPYMPSTQFSSLINALGAAELFQLIPEGVIVEVVRPSWDLRKEIGTCLNVSHMGFLFESHGQVVFRHASKIWKKVADELFSDYLEALADSDAKYGFAFFQVMPEK